MAEFPIEEPYTMSKLNTAQIKDLAKDIIRKNEGGIRYSELVKEIRKDHPETIINTISGSIWNLDAQFPNEIVKPSRGLYAIVRDTTERQPTELASRQKNGRATEEDFYEPFADWLKSDLDEVAVATDLGGAGLQKKWGTPDVVGVYKPLASNLIKFPLEIVSAEIKIDPNQSVVAFGQAVAYRLFSSKTYIVMPRSITEEDLSRLEALCVVNGVGLVTFELNSEEPEFSIRVRAQRFPPDMFYVNEFADRLRQHNSEKFELLFG
jgi:hypothetical protein